MPSRLVWSWFHLNWNAQPDWALQQVMYSAEAEGPSDVAHRVTVRREKDTHEQAVLVSYI